MHSRSLTWQFGPASVRSRRFRLPTQRRFDDVQSGRESRMEAPTPADVNFAAIAIATLVVLLLALAWYRPRSSIHTKSETALAILVTVALAFFAVLTQAIVEVAHSPYYWAPATGRHITFADGLRGGAFIWGAWVLPVLAGLSSWGERSWKAFARDAAYFLLALLIAGAITAQWTRSG